MWGAGWERRGLRAGHRNHKALTATAARGAAYGILLQGGYGAAKPFRAGVQGSSPAGYRYLP